ncbi:MAG: DUF3566 domain-containing protein [Acidimicrobiia bacterium]
MTRPTTGSTTGSTSAEPRTAEPRPSADPRPSDQRTSSPQPRATVPAPTPAPVPAVAAPVERRYRQTVHRVDLWTVLKMSVCFYLCTMAVAMIAIVALWAIGDAVGVISSVEKFLGELLQTKDFTFLDGQILQGVLLVGAVLVVLAIVLTVIAAAFYNLFAELFGGIELTISEDESAI